MVLILQFVIITAESADIILNQLRKIMKNSIFHFVVTTILKNKIITSNIGV